MKLKAELSDDQAMALAKLAKRFTYEDARRLSTPHDSGLERDNMLKAVLVLSRALAEGGFAPR
jgi:hypothetical protein